MRPPQSDALTIQAGARAERHERRTAHKTHTEEVGEGVDATSAGATSGRRAPLPTLDVGSQPRPYNRSSRFLYDRADDDKELDFTCVWSSVCDKPAAYSLLPSSLCSHLPAGIELATQRVMLMRMAQPALMPDPRCLDAPPAGKACCSSATACRPHRPHLSPSPHRHPRTPSPPPTIHTAHHPPPTTHHPPPSCAQA